MSHIKLIGVELEGAWDKLNYDQANSFKHDGSVSIERKNRKCKDDCMCNCESCKRFKKCCYNLKNAHIGEIVSPPMKIKDVLKWCDKNYPTYTNRTCGLHIHISLSIMDYSRLEDRKFYFYVLEKLKEWGLKMNLNKKGIFWDRISGKVTHCKAGFYPEAQVHANAGFGSTDRYRILNACYHKHGTYEIRVLPCFQKKEIALKAIKFMYDIIEAYLDQPEKMDIIKFMVNTEDNYQDLIKEMRMNSGRMGVEA